MPTILSSDEFVAGVMAALTLRGNIDFVLNDTDIDEKFENAYQILLAKSSELGIVPNFSFQRDHTHGNSACLRDTLLSAKEKKIIALNNPTLWTFNIKLNKQRAERYLQKNPVNQGFYEDLATLFD